ncbi:MAG: Glutathione S-transferase, N-terminal domain [Hydrocarboniphaga sp.]|uniref:glutathione S-transferase N-terminal domain-containing protein n=1 Tax=Hydrocarboniphaga sp. TaxID=2033016 RepID=UPI0026297F99|nr:glutathione S-transferase N-terminal domain-containing protein [Hydrocarboniphaga sp.]MDB5968431.1 Glutathione S-transferase, N-terminal domain [Hydrocarboniphaga sp.]
MSTQIDALINLFAGTARLWRGTLAHRHTEPPAKMLKLYDIEACSYCRLVRETLTELDLDAMILPCPKNGTRFRGEARAVGGKTQFPLLVDDNTGTVLYESADIIDYLHRRYARGKRRSALLHPLAVLSSQAASVLMIRAGGFTGMRALPSRAPAQPLELFSFEASPFSKPVRARMCELELPYRLRNTGKGGWKDFGPPGFRDTLFKGEMRTTRNRRWLADNTGQVQVPYLIDDNTGTAMYESGDILKYLDRTYLLHKD